jgi:hypothetical protein
LFSKNSINTSKVELGNPNLEIKNISITVNCASKFISKIVKQIDNNSIPNEVPDFARSLFDEQTTGGFVHLLRANNATKPNTHQISTTSNKGGRHKTNVEKPNLTRQKDLSDNGLKMDLFHIKKPFLTRIN